MPLRRFVCLFVFPFKILDSRNKILYTIIYYFDKDRILLEKFLPLMYIYSLHKVLQLHRAEMSR